VSFAHLRTRRRLALLASGVLEADERERALLHVAGCSRCAAELQGLRAALEQVASDPVRGAEPQLDIDALVRLTQARIDRLSAAPEPARPRSVPLWAPLAAAAAVAAIALAIRLAPPAVDQRRASTPVQPSRAVAAQEVSWPDESLRRLERTVEREQAARYLSEAEAVLVTVAATPQRCDRNRTTVDMAQERRRSRELLARGALLVDFDSEEIRSVRPVLEELRERRLLMKIDLMTRELLG